MDEYPCPILLPFVPFCPPLLIPFETLLSPSLTLSFLVSHFVAVNDHTGTLVKQTRAPRHDDLEHVNGRPTWFVQLKTT